MGEMANWQQWQRNDTAPLGVQRDSGEEGPPAKRETLIFAPLDSVAQLVEQEIHIL